MKVRYTITSVQFVPGSKTAEASVRAKLGEGNLGDHQQFTVPVEVVSSLDALASATDAAFVERYGFPSDTVFECISFSQRAVLGL
jgi:hypothetical protein